jgi:hypothetical protein
VPLIIVQPAPNAQFNIDAIPRMPTIQCQARITGVQPDPTANTSFNWSAQITEIVRHSTCASSNVGNCQMSVNGANVRGGMWRPAFDGIQGGDAVITVAATIQGAVVQAAVNVRIRGTNPASAIVRQQLGGVGSSCDHIACVESRWRQFDGAGMPLLGPGGDVGVMQLCGPTAASCAQRWDWTANVGAGMALFNQKQNEARVHLDHHRVEGHYPNDQGLDDADVLQREAIQRYNTGSSYWRWNAPHNQWVSHPPNHYVATVLACQ